ncbi:sulfocyanin-like copper-binding protein [Alicyclobacillus vulcanalis]|nr:sulfocyanin-like copper-binding protein [Alicyclobacillus vulcanalis]
MRKRLGLVLSMVTSVLVGCGASHPSPLNQDKSLLTWNAAKHEVRWKVVAGDGRANGGMNFDGYANGSMTLVVPIGWRVVIDFDNASLMPHSAMVVPYGDRERSNFDATMVAFPGAETPNPSQGDPQGTHRDVIFTAAKVGTYALVCGVPGHALAGMWDQLVVSDEAKHPSLRVQRDS